MMVGVAVAFTVFALGCGDEGPGTFVGTVDGESLRVRQAVYVAGTDKYGIYRIDVFMSDTTDLCYRLSRNIGLKNANYVKFSLWLVSDGFIRTPSAGVYTVIPDTDRSLQGRMALGYFDKTNENCASEMPSAQGRAVSGAMDVIAFDKPTYREVFTETGPRRYELFGGGPLVADFDVTFGTQGDRVTGTIEAGFCRLPTINFAPRCE